MVDMAGFVIGLDVGCERGVEGETKDFVLSI